MWHTHARCYFFLFVFVFLFSITLHSFLLMSLSLFNPVWPSGSKNVTELPTLFKVNSHTVEAAAGLKGCYERLFCTDVSPCLYGLKWLSTCVHCDLRMRGMRGYFRMRFVKCSFLTDALSSDMCLILVTSTFNIIALEGSQKQDMRGKKRIRHTQRERERLGNGGWKMILTCFWIRSRQMCDMTLL